MNQDIKRTLWVAADKLRSSMDAAEYKHIVLGLIFFKCISDAFDERREALLDDLGEIRHIDESDWGQWTRRVMPRPDDIVFSYEEALGLFALISPGLHCCLGRRLALFRSKLTGGTPHFWFHQFIDGPFQQLLAKHTVHGATVNRIALREFSSFPVLDPGQAARETFEQFAAPLWARIHANRQQALNLAELRDAPLPRLISGKLCLPEAKEQLEGVIA